MTAVAASKRECSIHGWQTTKTGQCPKCSRPTFVQQIANAYVEAAVFALGELAEANKSVLYFAEHGEGRGGYDAHMAAFRRAQRWQIEAAECEGMVLLLEAMADGQ